MEIRSFLVLSLACLFSSVYSEDVTSEFLDQLLADQRYEEFEKHVGITARNASRTNEGDPAHNPMFNEGLHEGDMLFLDKDEEGRQAVRNRNNRWPGRPALVPYELNRFSPNDRRTIEDTIRHWNRRVRCVKWIPRRGQSHFVDMYPGNGCYAVVGYVRSRQALSLGNGCVHRNIILHEMEHAIGIGHEQARDDRDNYIEILWHNIPDNWKSQYNKDNPRDMELLGRYDYYSVMHYGIIAPGTNKKAFNVRRGGIDENRIGNGRDFSRGDIWKLWRMYCCR